MQEVDVTALDLIALRREGAHTKIFTGEKGGGGAGLQHTRSEDRKTRTTERR